MNIQNDISNRQDIMSLFSNPSKKALFACLKKSEKIVAAIHLVTDVMEAKSSLTTELQTISLNFLSQFHEMFTGESIQSKEDLFKIITRIDHLLSLIRIGLITRQISSMNASMLTGELEKVSRIITEEIKVLVEGEKSFATLPGLEEQPALSDTLLKDTAFAEALSRAESKRHQNDIKTTLMRQNDIVNTPIEIKTTLVKDIQKKVDRKGLILDSIKSRTESTIHDIKKNFPDISEKTLQREINSLIEMNLIKREGNKRWTIYRMADKS